MWALRCVHTHNSKHIFTKWFALFLCCKRLVRETNSEFPPKPVPPVSCLAAERVSPSLQVWFLEGSHLLSGALLAVLGKSLSICHAPTLHSCYSSPRPTAVHPPHPSLHPLALGSPWLAGFSLFTVQFLSLLWAWKPVASPWP